MTASQSIDVQIWSDVACPWCFVGKRRFDAALRAFAGAPHVNLTWRSFELDTGAPAEAPSGVSYAQRLGQKYGRTEAQSQAMIDNIVAVGRQENVEMDFTRIKPSNTFDGHRMLHFAHRHGRQTELKERLFQAYFCEGQRIASHDVLVQAAAAVGLDEEQALGVLGSDAFAADVRADEDSARQLGISGVPFFVIGRYGVSGAQPVEALVNVLDKAWAEVPRP